MLWYFEDRFDCLSSIRIIYSRGWKFVYLVLKYTPFYSVLAGSVSLSQEKGVVICSHFSLLTQTPLPSLFLTLPFNITNYFSAKWETVKQPFYGTQNEIFERLISKSSRIKRWCDRMVAINRICLSALFSIHLASCKGLLNRLPHRGKIFSDVQR
jgi:hypothetical protein